MALEISGGGYMDTSDTLHDRSTTAVWPGWWAVSAETEGASAVPHPEMTDKMGNTLAGMGDVIGLFSDPASFRRRLDYIGETLSVIAQAWSSPNQVCPAATLGVLQELAKNGAVPAGCERTQETLLDAMRLYREAAEDIYRAKLDGRPSECEAAWARITEGHALVTRAMGMATEGKKEAY